MAISSGLRNRLVGFAIVLSAVIILLPLVLSKDMLRRQEPHAIAINSQGAVYDAEGNLQYQSTPDLNSVFKIQPGSSEEQTTSQIEQLPSTNQDQSVANVAEVSADNSVEMLEFSSGGREPASSIVPEPIEETLVVSTEQPKQVAKEEKQTANQQPSVNESKVAKAESNKDNKLVANAKPTTAYAIQVGVFSQKANADNLVKKISQAGIKVYMVEISSSSRTLYRIYASGANNRNDLNQDLQRIEKLCNIKGKIVAM